MKAKIAQSLATANSFTTTATATALNYGKVATTQESKGQLSGLYCSSFINGKFDGYSFQGESNWKEVEKNYYKPCLSDNMDKLEKVVTLGIDKAIVISCLKRLYASGNKQAYDLMTGHIGIFDINDLQQEVLIALKNCENSWDIGIDDRLYINENDIDAIKSVYGAVSHFMYNFAIRHYNHEYISIDNTDVRADDIQALATYTDINDVISNEYIEQFRDTLSIKEDSFFTMRAKGYTLQKIADKMDVTMKKVRTIEKHVREKWTIYNK